MSIIFLLVPLAILIALTAIVAFFWALNSGQFDDVDTPAQRILFDDLETTNTNKNNKELTHK